MQYTIYMYVSNGYCVVITSLFPQCYTTVTMLSEAVILKTTTIDNSNNVRTLYYKLVTM